MAGHSTSPGTRCRMHTRHKSKSRAILSTYARIVWIVRTSRKNLLTAHWLHDKVRMLRVIRDRSPGGVQSRSDRGRKFEVWRFWTASANHLGAQAFRRFRERKRLELLQFARSFFVFLRKRLRIPTVAVTHSRRSSDITTGRHYHGCSTVALPVGSAALTLPTTVPEQGPECW